DIGRSRTQILNNACNQVFASQPTSTAMPQPAPGFPPTPTAMPQPAPGSTPTPAAMPQLPPDATSRP
ncbi:MAG: hypothetical protein AAFQ91_25165, partial [Cyanobacteria bacterium J06621_15]